MTRMIPRLLLAVLLLSVEFASAQRAPIPQQLTFTPYHSTGIYKIGETVGWTVTPGPVTPTYAYKYIVRRNNNVVLKEGKLDLSSGKDTIEITGDQPEMIYVAIEPYAVLPSAAPAADATAPAPASAAVAAPLHRLPLMSLRLPSPPQPPASLPPAPPTPEATLAATTASMQSAPPSLPCRSASTRRVLPISMPSGTES